MPLNPTVAGPLNRGQPNPSLPIHQIQSWTIRPFVANLPDRSQSNPPWPTHPILSWLTCPIVSSRHIVSNRLNPINFATQSCLTCPIVAGPPFHGHPFPCNRGERTRYGQSTPCCPSRAIQYANPPRRGLTRPIAANPRQCNREHASSSQRHASRAKPGQSQARLRPSQPLLRQARLF